jgi:hypothetical protein
MAAQKHIAAGVVQQQRASTPGFMTLTSESAGHRRSPGAVLDDRLMPVCTLKSTSESSRR